MLNEGKDFAYQLYTVDTNDVVKERLYASVVCWRVLFDLEDVITVAAAFRALSSSHFPSERRAIEALWSRSSPSIQDAPATVLDYINSSN